MTADQCDIIDLDSEPEQYRPDGLAAERWAPDMQLVPAMLTVPQWPRRLTEYDASDRAWIVAGLGLAGWSANEIVDRIGGSIRLIRDIRSQPFTECCRLWQLDLQRIEAELRVERINRAAAEHQRDEAARTAERLRIQREQILKAREAGEPVNKFPCGCPKVPHNIYREYGERNGRPYCRERCRECGNRRIQRHRDKHKAARLAAV